MGIRALARRLLCVGEGKFQPVLVEPNIVHVGTSSATAICLGEEQLPRCMQARLIQAALRRRLIIDGGMPMRSGNAVAEAISLTSSSSPGP